MDNLQLFYQQHIENRRKYKIDSILTDWTPPEVNTGLALLVLRVVVTSIEQIWPGVHGMKHLLINCSYAHTTR